MNLFTIKRFLFLLLFASLISCGGSGGGSSVDEGIGGTGKSSRGTVDGFGSIFVNGVEYETDTASITLDGNSATEADLRLGMVVTVRGSVDANGVTGIATEVDFDDDIQGPITAITTNADGTQKTLTVLNTAVLVDQTTTVFDDVSFATLAINDVIEVSGFLDSSATIVATRVEKKEDFISGSSEIEVKGTVSALLGTQFTLNTFTVDFSAADLSDVPGGVLSNGMLVEVKGTLAGSTITASSIEEEDGPFSENEEDVSIEGIVTNFVSISDFFVGGQRVDATNAQLQPVNLVIENDQQIEVEGPIVNGILQAESIEARSGEIKLQASIQAIDSLNGDTSITLSFFAGTVSFIVDNQTELRDETDRFDPLIITDINTGDFLEVKALINDSTVIATELRLIDPSEEIIRGPVDSFVSDSSVTILGVTFSTVGASFEDSDDQPIDATTFYSQLDIGDIVKVEDSITVDGIANEVEFED